MEKHQQNVFINTVLEYYNRHKRTLPWRQPEIDGTYDPYKILVSEIMLQQTQVSRVIPKYEQFLSVLPTVNLLAAAPLADVLLLWSGLGYNRRAKYLHESAKKIVEDFDSKVPRIINQLVQLPGVGTNTAAAVLTYAFSQQHAFIETNVRSVYIYHFFSDQDDVTDNQLWPVIKQTLETVERETGDYRSWYWAVMDYGTWLKRTSGNNARQSKSYTRQSKFEGSNRQVRGRVIKLLLAGPKSLQQISDAINDERCDEVIADLEKEQMIVAKKDLVSLQ